MLILPGPMHPGLSELCCTTLHIAWLRGLHGARQGSTKWLQLMVSGLLECCTEQARLMQHRLHARCTGPTVGQSRPFLWLYLPNSAQLRVMRHEMRQRSTCMQKLRSCSTLIPCKKCPDLRAMPRPDVPRRCAAVARAAAP